MQLIINLQKGYLFMKNELILIGNPNTGKTTLFNTLTRSNEKVSNWHGVTVGEKTKKYQYNNEEYSVTDLPGMYSLEGYSNEEKIASQYIKKNKNKLIVNICDANNLERNLRLTTELVNLGCELIVVVNMCKECHNFDYKKLSECLGVFIVEIDARKQDSVRQLQRIIERFFQNKKTQKVLKTTSKTIKYNELIKICAEKHQKQSYKHTDNIDKILLNKWIFITVFIALIFLMFYVTFGLISEWFLCVNTYIFNIIKQKMQYLFLCINITDIVKVLIVDAVIPALEILFSFIPQILSLMFFLNLFEDVGLMSRLAFMFDGVLKKIGLTGKSLFSILMGYGCTTSSIITTRNLETLNLRKRTVLLLPMSSCSAKLPVFLVVASLFFEKYKFLFIGGLYLFSILIQILLASIYMKFIPSTEDVFILEMPKYRIPSFGKILKNSFSVLYDFIRKTVVVLLIHSVIFWILKNFTFQFEFLEGKHFEQSMIYNISKFIAPIFSPIGLGGVGVVVALLMGVVAKEMILVGLALLNGVSDSVLLSQSLMLETSICSFSKISSVVFLIFILLYSPCILALDMIRNELGIKTMLYVFVFQFLLAYIVSYVVFLCLSNVSIFIIFALMIILDIFVVLVLKFKHRKKRSGDKCNACRRICGVKNL